MHPARRSQVVTYLLLFFFSTIAAFIPRSTGTLSIPEIRGRTKMSSISEKDKYLFDLNGYIVIREVLTSPEIETCNRAIDTKQDLARERRSLAMFYIVIFIVIFINIFIIMFIVIFILIFILKILFLLQLEERMN